MASRSLGLAALEGAAEAATGGNYESAYHFLMAAVHIADKSSDMKLLSEVCRLAAGYGAAVDAVQPDHPLSSSAASTRGQTPLYATLQVHAEAVELRHAGHRKQTAATQGS